MVGCCGCGGFSGCGCGGGQQLCFFFAREGWCKFGDQCRQLHQGPDGTFAGNLTPDQEMAALQNQLAMQQHGMMQSGMQQQPGLPPGDWMCPGCNDHQFARNATCRRCGTPRPSGVGGCAIATNGMPPGQMKQGDWNCPGCGDLQFARNSQCRKCATPKPLIEGGGTSFQPLMGGDWLCPGCGDHQFSRNPQCRKCATPKPGTAGIGILVPPPDRATPY